MKRAMATTRTTNRWPRTAPICAGLCLLALNTATAQEPPSAASRLEPSAVALFPAQDGPPERAESSAPALPLPSYGSWVGVAKWVTLGTSVGLGAWGFKLNGDADGIFSRLERRCRAQPENCRSRNPDGTYTDPNLEARFQKALDKDDQARTALVASQLFFGASVVLFIVDFQRDDGPDNEPYDPDEGQSPLRLTAIPGEIVLRYYFR